MADTNSHTAPGQTGAEGAARREPTSSQIRTRAPTRFGKYELLQRIRVGGMAEVYRARELAAPDRLLAIKRILPSLTDEADYVAMFVDEARLGLKLSHPNVVAAYELGVIEDEHYIALEYVAGVDVATILRRARERAEPVPIHVACQIMREVCAALHHAHELRDESGAPLGIVHRDVSPQNVLVSYDGEVKLIDFGIAKSTQQLARTQAGLLKGKHGYLSPEQAQGHVVDRQSDVFSAGICLYEMLSAERLFNGSSDFSTVVRVRNAQVAPLHDKNPQVPPELASIAHRALARERDDRYRTAAELGDALERFMAESGHRCDPGALSTYVREGFAYALVEDALVAEPQRDDGTGLLDAFDDLQPVSAVSVLADVPAREASPADAVAPYRLELESSRATLEIEGEPSGVELEEIRDLDAEPESAAPADFDAPAGAGEDMLEELRADEPTRVVAYESTLSGQLAAPQAGASAGARADDTDPQGLVVAPAPIPGLPGIGVDWDDDDLSTQIYDPPEDELGPMTPISAPANGPLRTSLRAPAERAPAEAFGSMAPRASTPPGMPAPFALPPAAVVDERRTSSRAPSAASLRSAAAGMPAPGSAPQLPHTGAAVWIVAGGLALAAVGVPGTLLLTRAPESGSIHFTTDPVDAVVTLDGVPASFDTSPFDLSLEPDVSHAIGVSKPGYRPWRTRLTLAPGQRVALPHVQLAPEVNAEPATPAPVLVERPGAESQIAPGPRMPAPARSPSAPAGPTPSERRARAPAPEARVTEQPEPGARRAPAPEPVVTAPPPRRTPSPAPGMKAEPRPEAQPEAQAQSQAQGPGAADAEATGPAAAGETGVLRINSRPWSKVIVDGRFVGNTPQTNLVLGAGRHTVTLVNPEFGLQRVLTVTVKADETITEIVELAE